MTEKRNSIRTERSLSAGKVGSEDVLIPLIEAITRRDENALRSLHKQTFSQIYALALAIVSEAADADEVTHDVYRKVWNSSGQFDAGRGKVLSWMLTACRSRALDVLRRRKTRVSAESNYAAEPLTDNTAASMTDLLELLEAGSAAHAALEQLGPEQRKVLSLAYLKGLTHAEISRQTGLPLGTVKSHIQRGLITLRNLLEERS